MGRLTGRPSRACDNRGVGTLGAPGVWWRPGTQYSSRGLRPQWSILDWEARWKHL